MSAMVTLSVQLMLYGATWLVLGIVFGVRRQAGFWWAAAFAWLAVSAWAVDHASWGQVPWTFLVVNTGVVVGFYCLMRGLAHMGKYKLEPLDTLAPVGLLVALLMVRWVEPDAVAVRMLLIGLAAGWPIVRASWLLRRLLTDTGFPNLYWPLGVAPVAAILCLLTARPLLVAMDSDAAPAYLLTIQSAYKDVFVLTGFVSLMLFNLAMAVVVVGGLIGRLRNLSNTDSLTQLPNRRSVMALLASEHDRYRRGRRVFSVLVVDIDHFKRVNDSHGHAAGDEVLVNVARTMRLALRATDVVARSGGEEFLAFLPDTDEDQAFVLAERMRLAVEQGRQIATSPPTPVTISVGIGTVAPADVSVDEVIGRADKAMYHAKHSGRNQVRRPTALSESIWSESLTNAH